jgi:hypothetical protein
VPNAELPDVLRSIAGVLTPGGLFFLGVCGGGDQPAERDDHAADLYNTYLCYLSYYIRMLT